MPTRPCLPPIGRQCAPSVRDRLLHPPGEVARQTIPVARSYSLSSLRAPHIRPKAVIIIVHVAQLYMRDRPQSLLECFESPSIRLSFPLISSKLKQIPVEITRKCFLISHQLKGRMAVEITVCVPCMSFSLFGGKYWDPLPQHASCVFLQPPPAVSHHPQWW